MQKSKGKIKKFELQPKHLVISGITLILIFMGWRYYNARILSFSEANLSPITYDLIPVHITAYPVGVDVDTRPAKIIDGVWPVFSDSAGYVVNGNNLIIYGHNKDNIMGPIRYIKEGAEITIKADDNQEYDYNVVKIDTVEPDNLNYIKSTEEETLTVYTCTGFLDSKRFIVVAKRIN